VVMRWLLSRTALTAPAPQDKCVLREAEEELHRNRATGLTPTFPLAGVTEKYLSLFEYPRCVSVRCLSAFWLLVD
jgi:hypothetical protein